jgi:CheY-like chemotaxis protein
MALKTCRVMVVDDEVEVREALRDLVQELGYEAVGVANGVKALEQLRGGLRPELLLTDLAMPEMNGWQLVLELATDPELREIPVAILTAFDESRIQHPQPFRSAGTLLKPCRKTDLVSMLERFCGPANGGLTD